MVCFHLYRSEFPQAGTFAVFGFYTISGYVITLALHGSYADGMSGFGRFWKNRALRLYPSYLVAALFGVLLASLLPEAAQTINSAISLTGPDGLSPELRAYCLTANVTLIGLFVPFPIAGGTDFMCPIRFAPPSWSTNMELFFYALMSAIAGLSFRGVRIWFGVSLLSAACIVLLLFLDLLSVIKIGKVFSLWYYTAFGTSLAFSLGALAWHLQASGRLHLPRSTAFKAVCLVLVVGFPLMDWSVVFHVWNGYVSPLLHWIYALLVALFLCLFDKDVRSPTVRFLGDISYPVFLMHWQSAILVTALLGYQKNSAELLVWSAALAIALSIGVVALVEHPIRDLRARIRGRKV